MKKITVFTIVIFLVSFHSFSEIISWKGMELGLSPNPKWLESYIKNNDKKQLRKKFDIPVSEKVVVGSARAESLEEARSASQLDAQTKAAGSGTQKVRLQFIYEYWEEDDKKGFTVYSVYAL